MTIRNFVLCASPPGSSGSSRPSARGRSSPTLRANEILFLAIAAAVIGGTLLAGGSGTVSAR